MRYQLIIFDWDGTMMDSAPRISTSMQKAAELANLPPLTYQQASNIIGLSLKEAGFALYPDATAEQLRNLAEHYRDQFVNKNTTPMPLFAGARALLDELKARGYLLAVATGKSRSGLDRTIASVNLDGYFAATRTGSDAESKPSPDMILQILAELNIKAQDALMVGDTEYDLLMAKNAGVDSIGVSFGVHDNERLKACGPLTLIDSLPQLLDWV